LLSKTLERLTCVSQGFGNHVFNPVNNLTLVVSPIQVDAIPVRITSMPIFVNFLTHDKG